MFLCSEMYFCGNHARCAEPITRRISAFFRGDIADKTAFHAFDFNGSGVGINGNDRTDRVLINHLIADAFILFVPGIRE